MVSNIVKIALLLVIVALAYFVFESVMKPVRFNKQVDARSEKVVERLKDIRAAQMSYKTIHGRYTKSFDTLIDFIKNGQIPVVKIIPDPTDTTFTRTIRDTLGMIVVGDSLFKNRKEFVIEDIRYIPFTENISFDINAGTIQKGGVTVHVFEVSALYEKYLEGLNKQLVINLIDSKNQISKFPGLKLGSITEASTDGNWE